MDWRITTAARGICYTNSRKEFTPALTKEVFPKNIGFVNFLKLKFFPTIDKQSIKLLNFRRRKKIMRNTQEGTQLSRVGNTLSLSRDSCAGPVLKHLRWDDLLMGLCKSHT